MNKNQSGGEAAKFFFNFIKISWYFLMVMKGVIHNLGEGKPKILGEGDCPPYPYLATPLVPVQLFK